MVASAAHQNPAMPRPTNLKHSSRFLKGLFLYHRNPTLGKSYVYVPSGGVLGEGSCTQACVRAHYSFTVKGTYAHILGVTFE